LLLLLVILAVTVLAHAVNMFDFPYYEDDEGTYVSQAWAVLVQGRLAPYTYWYDHAPVGWIQIAGWGLLSGGLHTFGSAIESGRVLMLGFQVASTALLFWITRRLSGSLLAAAVACLLFSLSPYAINYHRRVLLDNITTFWMLLSIWLLVGRISLKRVWLSALALAISILSKELTIFLVPAMSALVWLRTPKQLRAFALSGWVAVVGCVFSLYFVMAALNGELFPTGTLLGGTADHVSLLGSLQFQTSRGKDGGLLDLNSLFWGSALGWVHAEPCLVVGGTACALLALLFLRRRPAAGVVGLLTLSLWGFLGRGGEVIDFYLLPLLPLLALNVALAVSGLADLLHSRLKRPRRVVGRALRATVWPSLAMFAAIGALGGYLQLQSNQEDPLRAWHAQPAVGQRQATSWILGHVPSDSRTVIDMYMWVDLHPDYEASHYYWKVEQDPAIRDDVFADDWRTIDYIITTPQMLFDARLQDMHLVNDAVANSTALARFDTGWPVEVRQVHPDVSES
jgi:4-amino-4-deoxy-L-arabinose transferase-like glycosyltransferase